MNRKAGDYERLSKAGYIHDNCLGVYSRKNSCVSSPKAKKSVVLSTSSFQRRECTRRGALRLAQVRKEKGQRTNQDSSSQTGAPSGA